MKIFLEYYSYIFFLDIFVFYIILNFYLWTGLEKLTNYLKDKYPNEWIRLGSLRFFKGTISTSKDSLSSKFGTLRVLGDRSNLTSFYSDTGSNKSYKEFYKFIKKDYKKLNDSALKNIISSIKNSFWALVLSILILVSYIVVLGGFVILFK